MQDIYKVIMHKRCGKGGIKCECCNGFKGKKRKILHRLARRVLKQFDERLRDWQDIAQGYKEGASQ